MNRNNVSMAFNKAQDEWMLPSTNVNIEIKRGEFGYKAALKPYCQKFTGIDKFIDSYFPREGTLG